MGVIMWACICVCNFKFSRRINIYVELVEVFVKVLVKLEMGASYVEVFRN